MGRNWSLSFIKVLHVSRRLLIILRVLYSIFGSRVFLHFSERNPTQKYLSRDLECVTENEALAPGFI